MADKTALLKRVMRTQTTDVMHTSGYARVQNAGSFGSASTESFTDRRSIEEQRKFVRGYHNSKIIGGAVGAPRAKTYTPPPPKTFGGGPKTGATPPARAR